MKYLLYVALILALLFTLSEAQAKTQNMASFARKLARRQRSLVRGFESDNRVRRLHSKNRRQIRRVYSRLERRIDSERNQRPRRSRITRSIRTVVVRPMMMRRRRGVQVIREAPLKSYKKESNAAIKTINNLLGDISKTKQKVQIKVHHKKPIVKLNRVKENTAAEIAKIQKKIGIMIKGVMPAIPKFENGEFKRVKGIKGRKSGRKSQVGEYHNDVDEKKRLAMYQQFLAKLQVAHDEYVKNEAEEDEKYEHEEHDE
jgi:hypothetical protein